MPHNPIITAIDTSCPKEAANWVSAIAAHTGMIKLGLEFFVANGAAVTRQIAGDIPLFLDLKFHDIPNTVAGAVTSAMHTGCDMLTIHASGGYDMCKAAVDAANNASKPATILAVTILTSLNQGAIEEIGYHRLLTDQVLHLADMALRAGVGGLVCSPHEIAPLRKRFGQDMLLVTPGIRPINSKQDDQSRIMTPKEAHDAGANYLVIGRPITEAANPETAIQTILGSL